MLKTFVLSPPFLFDSFHFSIDVKFYFPFYSQKNFHQLVQKDAVSLVFVIKYLSFSISLVDIGMKRQTRTTD
jgi:hypothetical protein